MKQSRMAATTLTYRRLIVKEGPPLWVRVDPRVFVFFTFFVLHLLARRARFFPYEAMGLRESSQVSRPIVRGVGGGTWGGSVCAHRSQSAPWKAEGDRARAALFGIPLPTAAAAAAAAAAAGPVTVTASAPDDQPPPPRDFARFFKKNARSCPPWN